MFTARVTQHWGFGGTYMDSSHPKRFDHTAMLASGGEKKNKKNIFFPQVVDGIDLLIATKKY